MNLLSYFLNYGIILCMPNIRKFNDKEKWCPRCKKWLPLGDFADKPSADSPCKKQPYCQTCTGDYNKTKEPEYRIRRNAYQRRYIRIVKYGLTPEQVKERLEKQQFKCAICEEPITFETCQVDHDHATNRVRRLLCGLCNRGLGNFKDSVKLLEAAVRYLRAFL